MNEKKIAFSSSKLLNCWKYENVAQNMLLHFIGRCFYAFQKKSTFPIIEKSGVYFWGKS